MSGVQVDGNLSCHWHMPVVPATVAAAHTVSVHHWVGMSQCKHTKRAVLRCLCFLRKLSCLLMSSTFTSLYPSGTSYSTASSEESNNHTPMLSVDGEEQFHWHVSTFVSVPQCYFMTFGTSCFCFIMNPALRCHTSTPSMLP